MIVRFARPRVCWSWAVVNGGRSIASTVAWYFLDASEYPELADPQAFLRNKLSQAGLADAVGLLTSRRRYGQLETSASHSGTSASCVATVGLSNGMRIGDPPSFLPSTGTINLLCEVNVRLTESCALEALTIAAEARTAAVSDTTGGTITGTGTDCLVIAHSVEGDELPYAGKHTALGHVIGRAVYDAVHAGANQWWREHR